jgi:hypothetical protein
MEKTDLNIFFNQEQFHIIKIYKKLHRFLFKYGIFILIILLGIVGIYILVTKGNLNLSLAYKDTPTDLPQVMQAYQERITPVEGNFSVIIPYGTLSHTDGYLTSIGTLGTYQGVVMPRIFSLPDTYPLFDMTAFQQQQSTSGDINYLINALIKTISSSRQEEALPIPQTFTIKENIIMDFNLQCVSKIKLFNSVCETFLERFYQQGMFYPLGEYAEDMTTLMNAVIDRTPLCNLIYDTTLYQRKSSPIFDTLIGDCTLEQIQRYRQLKNFIEIEQELSNGIISDAIYNDNVTLNAYKLLSIQQTLYKNLNVGTLNKSYLMNYLDYSQTIIEKDAGNGRYLQPLYKDLLYQINNTILLPKLETHDNTILSKTEINQMINKINLLNKGNSALYSVGLEKQLTTPGLIQQREISEIDITTKDIEELLNPLLSMKDRLKVQKYTISPERTEIYLQTEISSTKIQTAIEDTLKIKTTLYDNQGNLYVKEITILNESELDTFLQSYLHNNPTSFLQLLNVIDENILFYGKTIPTEEQQDFCEIITELIGESANILECSDTFIDLFQAGINYSFSRENGVLTNVEVSDKALEQSIISTLQDTLLNKTTSMLLFQEILNIHTSTDNEETYVSEKLRINERMKNYLNVLPSIKDIDGEIFGVTFTLGDITLRGTYDILTHTITNIFYVI